MDLYGRKDHEGEEGRRGGGGGVRNEGRGGRGLQGERGLRDELAINCVIQLQFIHALGCFY